MSTTDANIHDFEYAAEESKKSFQAGISSLIELHGHLNSKYIEALQNQKKGVFMPNEEIKVLLEWILELSGSQLAHYIALDGINRKTNRLFRCALKLQDREPQTPSLKKLLA